MATTKEISWELKKQAINLSFGGNDTIGSATEFKVQLFNGSTAVSDEEVMKFKETKRVYDNPEYKWVLLPDFSGSAIACSECPPVNATTLNTICKCGDDAYEYKLVSTSLDVEIESHNPVMFVVLAGKTVNKIVFSRTISGNKKQFMKIDLTADDVKAYANNGSYTINFVKITFKDGV